jgi:hypothetical protein
VPVHLHRLIFETKLQGETWIASSAMMFALSSNPLLINGVKIEGVNAPQLIATLTFAKRG